MTSLADATNPFPPTVYMRFCLFEKDEGLEEGVSNRLKDYCAQLTAREDFSRAVALEEAGGVALGCRAG